MPLLKVSLLRIPALRSGLTMFLAQYFAIAALFFVVPVYLQTILGYDALQTGLKILPLSLGLILFSVLGSRLSTVRSARNIGRIGQLILGDRRALRLRRRAARPRRLALRDRDVRRRRRASACSRRSSATSTCRRCGETDTSEVGGLQGTFQNLGSSFGTAIVGSVFILLLTAASAAAVQESDALPADVRTQVVAATATGAPDRVGEAGGADRDSMREPPRIRRRRSAGSTPRRRCESLRQALFVVFALTVLGLLLSRGLPATLPAAREARRRRAPCRLTIGSGPDTTRSTEPDSATTSSPSASFEDLRLWTLGQRQQVGVVRVAHRVRARPAPRRSARSATRTSAARHRSRSSRSGAWWRRPGRRSEIEVRPVGSRRPRARPRCGSSTRRAAASRC